MDVCEGTLGKSERKQRHKGPRHKIAAMSEEGEVNGNGIRGRSRRQEPCMGSKACEQTHELEVAKQILGTSIKLQKMSVRTLWRD